MPQEPVQDVYLAPLDAEPASHSALLPMAISLAPPVVATSVFLIERDKWIGPAAATNFDWTPAISLGILGAFLILVLFLVERQKQSIHGVRGQLEATNDEIDRELFEASLVIKRLEKLSPPDQADSDRTQ